MITNVLPRFLWKTVYMYIQNYTNSLIKVAVAESAPQADTRRFQLTQRRASLSTIAEAVLEYQIVQLFT